MIVTTTDNIQNQEISSYLGVVTAEVIYGTNALRDFLLGFVICLEGVLVVMKKFLKKPN